MSTYFFAPEQNQQELLDKGNRALAFSAQHDFPEWQSQVGAKLRELLGREPAAVDPDIRIESETQESTYTEIRYVFRTEENADVPAHLLIPHGKGPFAVIVCLQGHSTGMHISLGRPKHPGDEKSIAGGRDFALQAVEQGYAALVIENRAFGERSDQRPDSVRSNKGGCHHASMVSLLLGRTMVGERVWDVSRALDTLEYFDEYTLDRDRIGCMGNSGGGTVTYFAACMDQRIKAAMPSSYVCSYRYSIGRIDHCQCNYIPGLMGYFDLQDLAGLIAPRPMVLVAGAEDPIFPIAGVRFAYETIRQIYAAAGAPANVDLVVGEGGHRFYPDIGWQAFRQITGW